MFWPLPLLCLAAEPPWAADFAHQPLAARPRLEVRYADATRASALIEAETYRVSLSLSGEGQRAAAVALRGVDGYAELGTLDVVARVDGRLYTCAASREPTRINLYRRGPYYDEVHWFDLQWVNEAGEALPLRGEVVLHCYPEKVHLELIAHATGPVTAGWAELRWTPAGAPPAAFELRAGEPARWGDVTAGDKLRTHLAFVHNVDPAHPVSLDAPAAIELRRGVSAAYDPLRGSYVVVTDNPGGFNYHYYTNPNHYETAQVRLQNGAAPAKVYLCHATRQHPGSVECGVVLDERGDMLPLTVQISKNFAGEKEEPFYNPTDTPFSETFVPLYLAAGEARELTSLHLYQNWGNWPLKQFSSLGAWMDYFHSSTGVTETTCFVPFKFGGLPGVAIADYRPMSQSMWDSQPQHDNVAGHRFLVYRSGGRWHHAEYLGTTYRSTGPNWMDIRLDYLSDDGALRASLDSFELPQLDELRNFLRLQIEVLKPVTIDDLGTDLHLLDMISNVQRLRYTHVAFGAADRQPQVREFPAADSAPLAGQPLEGPAPWAAVFGTRYEPGQGHQRGANSFVVRRFEATIGGQPRGPAANLSTTADGNTALALTVAGGAATLQPGDRIDAEFYIMPYGDDTASAATPAADAPAFAAPGPRLTNVARGVKLADFPARLRADGDAAEFTLSGPDTMLPVLIEGLSDWRGPRLEQRVGDGWCPVPHETLGNDGYQVYVDEAGTFGCVFRVQPAGEVTYRLARAPQPAARLWRQDEAPDAWPRSLLAISADWLSAPLLLRFPETIHSSIGLHQIDHARTDMPPLVDVRGLEPWQPGPGGSWWFDWTLAGGCRAGGRASPREDGAALEFWFFNGGPEATWVNTQFCLMLTAPELRDTDGTRQFIHTPDGWVQQSATQRGGTKRELCHYPLVGGPSLDWIEGNPDGWGRGSPAADAGLQAVRSVDGRHVMGIAWAKPTSLLSNWFIPCVHADPSWPPCPAGRQVSVRGRIWLIEGNLDDLLARWREEFGG